MFFLCDMGCQQMLGFVPQPNLHGRHKQFASGGPAGGKIVYIGREHDGSPLREGSQVKGPRYGEKMGQLIAHVDGRDHIQTLKLYEAELEQARVAVKTARATLTQAESSLTLSRTATTGPGHFFMKEPVPKAVSTKPKPIQVPILTEMPFN